MTSDQHPQADEAARYVLGQLSPQARAAFEVELAQSAALRALVQELEAGVEVMAQSAPPRPLPPELWSSVAQAISREADRKVVALPVGSGFWRHGWAAAAACLLALLGFAWWSGQKSKLADANSGPAPTDLLRPTETESGLAIAGGGSAPVAPRERTNAAEAEAVFAPEETNLWPVAELDGLELLRLRGQVAALRQQLDELARLVSRQQAVMAEPGRFQMLSLHNEVPLPGEAAPPAPLSAGLQRAIFYAMAQDMGWLATAPPAEAGVEKSSTSIRRTAWGIDFVELNQRRSGADGADTFSQTTGDANLAAAPVSVRTSGDVPGYVNRDAGRELVLAFDGTIVPVGTGLEFWSRSPSGQQLIGTTITGENPMVVTIPTVQIGEDLMIISNADGATSKVVGQFFINRYPGGEVPSPSPAP